MDITVDIINFSSFKFYKITKSALLTLRIPISRILKKASYYNLTLIPGPKRNIQEWSTILYPPPI